MELCSSTIWKVLTVAMRHHFVHVMGLAVFNSRTLGLAQTLLQATYVDVANSVKQREAWRQARTIKENYIAIGYVPVDNVEHQAREALKQNRNEKGTHNRPIQVHGYHIGDRQCGQPIDKEQQEQHQIFNNAEVANFRASHNNDNYYRIDEISKYIPDQTNAPIYLQL